MKITRVAVTYGELRSKGFPEYSNKKYEIAFEAAIQPGETARDVKDKLKELAKQEVQKEFGDNVDQCALDLPME